MDISIENMIMEKCNLPPIPPVARKVMEVVDDPNITSDALSDVISRDPALTARIINIANSPFYWCSRTIDTLKSAIIVIGFNTIRNLVIAISSKEIYKTHGLTEQLLWEHSMGVAASAGLIAIELKMKDREEAFIAGLLHDIGKIVLLNSDRKGYEDIIRTAYNEDIPCWGIEMERYRFSHAEVGAIVINKWHFSHQLESIIRYHNDIMSYKEKNEHIEIMISIIQLANLICNSLGIGRRKPDSNIDIINTPPVKRLMLNEEAINLLIEKTTDSFEKEKKLFE
ncbi:MAG: HDOD domain-containing protein [Nitrospirota bacterium]